MSSQRFVRSPISIGRRFLLGALSGVLLASPAVPRAALAQEAAAAAPSYRVILFLAEDGGPQEVGIQRLEQVWSEGESAERLRTLLQTGALQQLESVAFVPGGDATAIRVGDVTVRVKGVLREPRRDRLFLRVEVEGGRQAFVKEMVSGFEETIVLAYPLTEGNRSIVALIVPARSGG